LTKTVTYLNPPNATPPAGMYSHVARMAPGELAFIAGQVAVDKAGTSVGAGDLTAQVNQVFANLGAILKDLGTDFESVVQFTTYLTSADGIPVFMSARRPAPQAFPWWQVPAQHAPCDRPTGEARVPGGDRGHRPRLGGGWPADPCHGWTRDGQRLISVPKPI
jgi:enamine deaminase RidA (YjgF/YER057c/UK114 family)